MDYNDIIVSWSCTYAISHEHASPVLVYTIRLQASKSVSDHQILIKRGWKLFPSWTRRFPINFHPYLVGGTPTPPKNDGLRQLGWWHSQWKVIKFHGSKAPSRYWISQHFPMMFLWFSHGGNNGTAGNSLPISTGRTGEAKSSGTMFQSLLNWSWDDVPR